MTCLPAHWVHWIADTAMVEWESGDPAGFLLPRGVPVRRDGAYPCSLTGTQPQEV
jgi:hypothetical protein